MLFSVIIPTYNRCEFLFPALESVWAQKFMDYEVIVVDDGSTDGTWERLATLGSCVRVLRQNNAGPGSARNLGARNAAGDYLAFLDSDDVWFPWTLRVFAELITRHQRPAILAAKLFPFRDQQELWSITETPLSEDAFPDYLASHHSVHFVGAGMSVLRRDAFLRNGGYTEQRVNCEDHDLILRFGTDKGYVSVTAPVTLGWRQHAGSATTNRQQTVAGNRYLIGQEQRGAYPGGKTRRKERREIIARHVRPTALACLRDKDLGEGWRLYSATFGWHLTLG